MADVVKREQRQVTPLDVMDQMFDDWARVVPFRRPWLFGRELMPDEDMIRVDEFQDHESLVIRAELPGIDPDRDVELTVSDGMLNIRAERHHEEKKDEKGVRRREIRYGSFSRTLLLPKGAKESDIKASYKNGFLEIRVPMSKSSSTKVPITKG